MTFSVTNRTPSYSAQNQNKIGFGFRKNLPVIFEQLDAKAIMMRMNEEFPSVAKKPTSPQQKLVQDIRNDLAEQLKSTRIFINLKRRSGELSKKSQIPSFEKEMTTTIKKGMFKLIEIYTKGKEQVKVLEKYAGFPAITKSQREINPAKATLK